MNFLMIVIFLCMVVSLVGCSFANKNDSGEKNSSSIYGNVNLHDEHLHRLNVNGNVTLDGVTVDDSTQINGNLHAKNVQLGALQVNGNVKLENGVVKGESRINGVLNAEKSTFDVITIATKTLTLHSVTTKTITMTNITWFSASLTAELYDTTVIGDIIFKEAKGKVILHGTSSIQGNVVNGSIEEIK